MFFKMAHNALQSGRNKEIFLHQPQLAPFIGSIVRIQETGNLLGLVLVLQGPAVIPVTKLVIHVFPGILRFPQPQGIHDPVLVTQNGYVVRYGPHGIVMFMDADQLSVFAGTHVSFPAKPDIHGLIRFFYFPRESVAKPGIRQFHLLPVDNSLIKQPVLVTDTASVSRQAQGRHGINKAGCQPAQATVAQTGIRFFRKNFLQVKPHILQPAAADIFRIAVQQVCIQQPAQQKFNGKIIDLAYFFPIVGFFCLYPVFADQILDHVGNDLIYLFTG